MIIDIDKLSNSLTVSLGPQMTNTIMMTEMHLHTICIIRDSEPIQISFLPLCALCIRCQSPKYEN